MLPYWLLIVLSVYADTTSQYDAIRAYLKELDIADTVWIGLSRTSERPNFTWTDFRPLTGDGHWREAIPTTQEPACVAMDPAADFLWKVYPCGGPDIASFICEIPIPTWALGPRGCLLTELPSLTVLYIPEQSSLELTSDCGLDGTKRIACRGDADREDLLKQLTCMASIEDFEEKSTKSPVGSTTLDDLSSTEDSKTTRSWIWTSNTIGIDYGMPTRHRRETEETPPSTKSTVSLTTSDKPNVYTATNYDTEVTTTAFESAATMDLTTSKHVPEEISSVSTSTEQPDASSASFATTEAKISYSTTSYPTSEYSSSINQGQLISIIENGTMFDIIELNDTSTDHELKSNKEINLQSESTTFKPSVKLSNKNNRNKIDAPAKTKLSKKDVYKNADPKKSNYPPTKISVKQKAELKNESGNLTKETEMFPILTDPNERLNRTFRKDLPSFVKHLPLPVSKTEQTFKQNDKNISENNIQSIDHTNKFGTTEIEDLRGNQTETGKPIDPKLTVLNNNATKANDTEVEMVDQYKMDDADKESVFVDEENSNNNTTEYANETATSETGTKNYQQAEINSNLPPKPNRQRMLTRPQRRSFYPYFFSRVLG